MPTKILSIISPTQKFYKGSQISFFIYEQKLCYILNIYRRNNYGNVIFYLKNVKLQKLVWMMV